MTTPIIDSPDNTLSSKEEDSLSSSPDSAADPSSCSKKNGSASLMQSLRGWLRYSLWTKSDSSLKDVLEEVIEEHEEQSEHSLEPEERVMLHNVLSFGDIKVSDIMIPRTDIIAVSDGTTLDRLKEQLKEHRHTRMPVYEHTLDNVTGFIHVKDLLSMLSGEVAYDLKRVTRKLLFVPPSMRIIDLLVKMRQESSHMAMVIDEYGGTDGLVTMEDLFEEIVGDIQDEHDEDEDAEQQIHHVDEYTIDVSGRIAVEILENKLGIDLASDEDDDEFDTLAGLIFFQLGRVPSRGETITYESGITLEILDVDPRRIRKVRVTTTSPIL